MHFPRGFRLSPILGFALASVWSEARAGFVVESYSTPTTMTNFNHTLTVKPFDTTLGALSSVVITVSDRTSFDGYLINKSASAKNFSISESVNFTAVGSFTGSQNLTDELDGSKSYSQLLTGQKAIFGSYSLTGNTASQTVTDQSVLDEFASLAPPQFTLTAQAGVIVTGAGGNTSTAFSTTADETVTIRYNFVSPNIVPEPASLAMTAFGGVLIASACLVRKWSRERTGSGV